MTETYLWQQVPNQGYDKYGKGVVDLEVEKF